MIGALFILIAISLIGVLIGNRWGQLITFGALAVLLSVVLAYAIMEFWVIYD